jgi:hypothetical protein
MAGHQRDLAGFCFEFDDRPGQFGGDLGAPLLDAADGLDPTSLVPVRVEAVTRDGRTPLCLKSIRWPGILQLRLTSS